MSKFKVGDKVVCWNAKLANPGVSAGGIYTITKIDCLDYADGGYLMLEDVKDWNRASRFTLWEAAKEPAKPVPKPKFNVGDKVKFNNNLRTFKVWDDKVHTVSEVRLAVDDCGNKIDDGYQIRLTDSDMEWNHEMHLDAYVEPAIGNVRVSQGYLSGYVGEIRQHSNVQYKPYYRDAGTPQRGSDYSYTTSGDTPKPEPKTVLQEAEDIINGQRQNDYGTPEDSFSAIAAYWSVYLATDISAHDVALMMALLKIARMDGDSPKRDNYTDLLGYGALAHRIKFTTK